MLQYGFVVVNSNHNVSYDHEKNTKIRFSKIKLQELKSHRCPVIAKLDASAMTKKINSPVFKYAKLDFCNEIRQSAYYAFDTLTHKNIVPAFITETNEIKDLSDVLSDSEKKAFFTIISYLRCRYIRAEKRHPDVHFLSQAESDNFSATELDLSEDEIIKLFGRLPSMASNDDDSVDSSEYIPDTFGKLN